MSGGKDTEGGDLSFNWDWFQLWCPDEWRCKSFSGDWFLGSGHSHVSGSCSSVVASGGLAVNITCSGGVRDLGVKYLHAQRKLLC